MLQKAIRVGTFLANDPRTTVKIGQTPHTVIHRENKSSVRYFAPAADAEPRTPIFISMPLINTWTIFDLLPGRSVVEALTRAGAPVYLLDWGRPTAEDQPVRAVEFIDRILHRAIDRSHRHARSNHDAEMLDMIGYCVGGTFLAAYLARHPEAARRVALVATPIDFHQSGRLGHWASPESFPLDDIIDGLGNFPSELMKQSFAWLKIESQTGKWMTLWDRYDTEGFPELFAAMECWNQDSIDFAGECYRDYVRNCYFDNRLMDGSWVLGNETTDLSNCKIPALVVTASNDHIVPLPSAVALEQVWGGPVENTVVRGGHVGLCVGNKLSNTLARWIEAGVEV